MKKTEPQQRHSVLIASSSEGLPVAQALVAQLSEHAQATVWTDGPFGLSSVNIESLVQAASQCDFAVVVLTPDDEVTSRGITLRAPRDNLVFEMGLFIGALGRERTFLVYSEKDGLKLPTDLAGVVAATYDCETDGNLAKAFRQVAAKLREAMAKAPPRTNAVSMLDVLRERLSRSHQRQRITARLEALPGIADLRVWPEDRPEIEKIADLFVQFEGRGWANRTFVVFFGQHASRAVTVYQVFETLAILAPAKLYLCLENIERFLSNATERPISYLSVRDVFGRHIEYEYAEAQALFENRKMIQPVHRALADVRQHPDGRKARQIQYGGSVVDGLSAADLRLAISLMDEVRKAGEDVIRVGLTLSPTHIVISHWSREASPWMVVTATNSDKSHLLLFAETPLVVEKEGVLIYHGDPSRPPSSEAVPHWFIHSHLSAHGLEAWRCILHVHSDPLNTLAQAGDVKLDGGIFLPTVPHVEYGTERMGRLLAEAMTRCGTTGASVQNHGQWFVAQSFPAVLAQAVHAHEAANEKLRGAKKRRV